MSDIVLAVSYAEITISYTGVLLMVVLLRKIVMKKDVSGGKISGYVFALLVYAGHACFVPVQTIFIALLLMRRRLVRQRFWLSHLFCSR